MAVLKNNQNLNCVRKNNSLSTFGYKNNTIITFDGVCFVTNGNQPALQDYYVYDRWTRAGNCNWNEWVTNDSPVGVSYCFPNQKIIQTPGVAYFPPDIEGYANNSPSFKSFVYQNSLNSGLKYLSDQSEMFRFKYTNHGPSAFANTNYNGLSYLPVTAAKNNLWYNYSSMYFNSSAIAADQIVENKNLELYATFTYIPYFNTEFRNCRFDANIYAAFYGNKDPSNHHVVLNNVIIDNRNDARNLGYAFEDTTVHIEKPLRFHNFTGAIPAAEMYYNANIVVNNSSSCGISGFTSDEIQSSWMFTNAKSDNDVWADQLIPVWNNSRYVTSLLNQGTFENSQVGFRNITNLSLSPNILKNTFNQHKGVIKDWNLTLDLRRTNNTNSNEAARFFYNANCINNCRINVNINWNSSVQPAWTAWQFLRSASIYNTNLNFNFLYNNSGACYGLTAFVKAYDSNIYVNTGSHNVASIGEAFEWMTLRNSDIRFLRPDTNNSNKANRQIFSPSYAFWHTDANGCSIQLGNHSIWLNNVSFMFAHSNFNNSYIRLSAFNCQNGDQWNQTTSHSSFNNSQSIRRWCSLFANAYFYNTTITFPAEANYHLPTYFMGDSGAYNRTWQGSFYRAFNCVSLVFDANGTWNQWKYGSHLWDGLQPRNYLNISVYSYWALQDTFRNVANASPAYARYPIVVTADLTDCQASNTVNMFRNSSISFVDTYRTSDYWTELNSAANMLTNIHPWWFAPVIGVSNTHNFGSSADAIRNNLLPIFKNLNNWNFNSALVFAVPPANWAPSSGFFGYDPNFQDINTSGFSTLYKWCYGMNDNRYSDVGSSRVNNVWNITTTNGAVTNTRTGRNYTSSYDIIAYCANMNYSNAIMNNMANVQRFWRTYFGMLKNVYRQWSVSYTSANNMFTFNFANVNWDNV